MIVSSPKTCHDVRSRTTRGIGNEHSQGKEENARCSYTHSYSVEVYDRTHHCPRHLCTYL
jgi:hypothetical protein